MLNARERSQASPRTASSGSCECELRLHLREERRRHPRPAAPAPGRAGAGSCGLRRGLGVRRRRSPGMPGAAGAPGESPRGNEDTQRGPGPRPRHECRGGPAEVRRAAPGLADCRASDVPRRVPPGGRSGARWRAGEGRPVPGDPPGAKRPGRAGPAEAALQGPEPFDPPLPRRAGQGAPGQQLRDDRRVDRDREVHRCGHGAAMNGGGQLGGRGPQPAVLMKSGFQRCGQRRRNSGNQQRQRRPLRARLRGASGQAVPAQRRERIHIALRLQSGPDGVHRRRVAEALGPGVGHRRGVSHHAGHAQVGQQRFAVRGEQHVAG